MILGALDTSYLARKQARDERKRQAKTITSEILLALVSLVELEEEEYLIDEQQEADNLPDEEEDELEPERKKKKSEFVPLMVPLTSLVKWTTQRKPRKNCGASLSSKSQSPHFLMSGI